MNLPNTLTLSRIFLVPLLVVVLLTPPWALAKAQEIFGLTGLVTWLREWREIIAVAIFLVAASTDWLDGYLARKRDQITDLGKLLDPIADKLLTISAFIALVELRLAPAWMIVVIVGREFAVSGMRSIAAVKGSIIAASSWGKLKTASQIVAITLLILSDSIERWVRLGNVGKIALWVVLALSLFSMAQYFVSFSKQVGPDQAS
ncbi:MAG: CDP-diacylglycerol--glycerol-3-phosphate 3-phosphatidyltransferase [Acidobacteria bacterium]|nr:MAG: CDP-diacylglycerol--glycerol-3-phosphate 3-phosphatidyltransferase [Acidobacteriota bacterium]